MNFSKSFVLSCSLAAISLMLSQPAWSIDVDVAEAPANDLALTVSAINSAQQTLQLNIYELSSPDVADALMGRIQAGVQVQVLVEGQPVGGMSAASKAIVSELVQAMQGANANDFVVEMSSKAHPKTKRRFRYDHAKYVVIDGSSVLVGSENYSPTGNPEPGTVGNRGWEVFVHDPALAQSFSQMFVSDSDTSNADIMNMSNQGVAYAFGLTQELFKKKPHPKPIVIPSPFPGDYGKATAYSQSMAADAVDTFHSPDTSLSGLQALLDSATTSIDIELMTFHADWGMGGGESPLLTSLINAAQRGVKVRVLLNDESVFNRGGSQNTFSSFSKPVNPVTIQALQNAAAQGLPIQALTANVKAMGVDYIHNKGMLIDGNRTMISSINWDENSVERNRETAVVVTSTEVYSHYEALFEQDWEASGGSSQVSGQAFSPRVFAPADFALVSNAPDYVAADSVNCPTSVEVAVQIGQLDVQQGEDASFAALSGQSFDLQMSRDKSSTSCIFMTGDRASKKRVFEIRGSHGETLFILEGYTSAGKLYSIRARQDSSIKPEQDLDARVYEGSGGHQSLGDAEMEVVTH